MRCPLRVMRAAGGRAMGPAMGRALNDADIVPRTVRSWMRWRRCGDVR